METTSAAQVETAHTPERLTQTTQETSRTCEATLPALENSRTTEVLPPALEKSRTMETARTYEETSRTQRSMCRAALHPTVHNFSGKIINKAVDEDQMVWVISGRHPFQLLPSQLPLSPAALAARSWSAGPGRGLGPYLTMDAARLPVVSGTFKTERVSAWTEDVHRRHVSRTARARARLSPKPPRVMERVVPTSPQPGAGGVGGGGGWGGGGSGGRVMLEGLEKAMILPLRDGADGGVDDIRLVTSSRATATGNDGMMTSRSRPATTGRYFDTSNGLRNMAALRSRPKTAIQCQWAGPGLKIKKVTLHPKELMT